MKSPRTPAEYFLHLSIMALSNRDRELKKLTFSLLKITGRLVGTWSRYTFLYSPYLGTTKNSELYKAHEETLTGAEHEADGPRWNLGTQRNNTVVRSLGFVSASYIPDFRLKKPTT